MVKALILSALIGGMSPYLPFWRFDSASQPVAVAIVISILSFVVIYPDEAKKNRRKRKMINTKVGKITLEGSKAELISDLAVIVRGIKVTIMEDDKETEESVKQDIDKAVKVGLMNEEEFRTFQKEKIKEAALAFVDGLLGGISNEDK